MSQQIMTKRIGAVIEVLAVFLTTFVIIWLLALLPLGQVTIRFLSYTVMIAIPLLILIATRRDLMAYGISFRNLKYHLDLALTAFIPVAVSGAIAGWFLPMVIPNAIIRWEGALILSVVEVVVLFWVVWEFRSKPTMGVVLSALVLLAPLVSQSTIILDRAVAFIFYLFFLGPGEEILFRGYIQSRLNETFGRPFHFFDVNWGWGLVITSLIFGAMHILNPFNPFLGKFGFYWWWGVWTFFGGFVAGYVREKTGSIVAPAILHGLPQAIASLVFGFFSVR